MVPTLIDRLDAALPQTQCTRCGYPACKPYAQAMARGQAPLNRCPPGGQAGIDKLAAILGQPASPLDPEFGVEGPRLLAAIESEHCIGCTKCIVACPVDAIIGGPRWMHTVLPELCTGCELCVPPCPVDCIRIDSAAPHPWRQSDADAARQRYQQHLARRRRNDEQDTMRHIDEAGDKLEALNRQSNNADEPTAAANRDRKRAIIEAAIAKARERQANRQ